MPLIDASYCCNIELTKNPLKGAYLELAWCEMHEVFLVISNVPNRSYDLSSIGVTSGVQEFAALRYSVVWVTRRP